MQYYYKSGSVVYFEYDNNYYRMYDSSHIGEDDGEISVDNMGLLMLANNPIEGTVKCPELTNIIINDAVNLNSHETLLQLSKYSVFATFNYGDTISLNVNNYYIRVSIYDDHIKFKDYIDHKIFYVMRHEDYDVKILTDFYWKTKNRFNELD